MPAISKRFYLLSLGCPKNDVDSDYLASSLRQAGWTQVDSPREADLMVVNTCSFIAPAVEETVEEILELAELRQEGTRRLAVTGCLIARYDLSTLASLLPEVDLFAGFADCPRFASLVEAKGEEEPGGAPAMAGRTSASTLPRGFVYLKIAEGCRRRCSYCAIPAIRGPLRSRPLEDIREEAAFFVREGARELVLIAQDTTSYGLDLYGEPSLPLLLETLSELEGEFRLRAMYMHPEGLNREILESMRRARIVPYLDLPFQHVDPDILAAMGRRGGPGSHHALLALAGEVLGEVALRSTFIVGYPGEDARSFRMLYEFVAEARFDWLGLFSYSQEEGTPAFSLGRGVPTAETGRRREALAELQEEIMREKALDLIGRRFQVLVEGASQEAPGFWEGRSFREAPDIDGVIFLPDGPGLHSGLLCEVEITASEGIDLIGEVKQGQVGLEDGQGRG